MASQRTKQLMLLDEDNRKMYILTVSPEEYESANTDLGYGAKLLAEFLKTGQPVTTEDVSIQENSFIDLCIDSSTQNSPNEVTVGNSILNEPLNMKINENISVEQQSPPISTVYNWKENEILLLIDCFQKEGVNKYSRKKDVSFALRRCVNKFNTILLEKEGKTIPVSKCYSKIDSLKRLYREKLDLQNKSGGQPCNWPYFKTLHEIFHKECWAKPLSVAGSNIQENLDVQAAEQRTKPIKPIQLVLEEMAEARRLKRNADDIKHKEKMIRLDRFTNCMESMAKSLSIISAAKNAKRD